MESRRLRWGAGVAAAVAMLLGASAASARTDPGVEACRSSGALWEGEAFANAMSVRAMDWSPFGASEQGWSAYLPLIQRELGVNCGAGSPDFAAALARFQSRYNLAPSGHFDAETFQVFRGLWQERRPFLMARTRGECPDPPPLNQLAYLLPEEEHADRLTRLLRRDVLDAYRRMAAAARAEVPEIAADPELLQIFSGFRDPEADAARCATHGNCDGLRRAVCSPHRTGTAIDLYVGHAPGMGVDSTHVASRSHMSEGPAYRWLVANADRFGFVPYVFEPWHWEYIGEAVGQGR